MNTQIQTREEGALDGRQVEALTILSSTELLANGAQGLDTSSSVIGAEVGRA